MSSCPPGVICMDNMTVLVIFIIGALLCYIYYLSNKKIVSKSIPDAPENIKIDIHSSMPPINEGVPINIRTQGRPTSYEQIGILTRSGGGPNTLILPLYGRELIAGRSKYQYYTYSDQNNSVRLPVSKDGKSCTGEYGCDMLYNGDTVYVEGYNMSFVATIYENNSMQYIPYI